MNRGVAWRTRALRGAAGGKYTGLPIRAADQEAAMAHAFKVGDHVRWNSEAGHVSGTIVAVHAKDFQWKGHTRHCSEDDPQYEILSDRTDHVAMHKGAALHRIP
jgi:hypothetical protein